MTTPAFLALGDIHLDTLIWRAYRQVSGDAVQAFKAVTQMAIDRHLPLVLVGDVFDVVDPDPWLVREFRLEMDRLARECVPVDVLQGNHDRRRTPWTTAVHDHSRYIGDGRPRDIGGLKCVAFDYDTRDNIQRKLSELQTAIVAKKTGIPQVLFLHQAVKQALRFEGQWNCDLEWVPEQIPLVVMGDIHTEWSARVRPGQMAYYTGASHPRDLSQLGQKTCMLVNDDLSIERLPFPGRPINAMQVMTTVDVEKAREWLQTALASKPALPPALFLKFGPDVGREVMKLEQEFTAALIMPKPLTEINLDQTVEQVTQDTTLNADELLRQLVDPEKEPQVHQLVAELLNSQDSVADVLHNRREHFTP